VGIETKVDRWSSPATSAVVRSGSAGTRVRPVAGSLMLMASSRASVSRPGSGHGWLARSPEIVSARASDT
jgi:hypothetical protein